MQNNQKPSLPHQCSKKAVSVTSTCALCFSEVDANARSVFP